MQRQRNYQQYQPWPRQCHPSPNPSKQQCRHSIHLPTENRPRSSCRTTMTTPQTKKRKATTTTSERHNEARANVAPNDCPSTTARPQTSPATRSTPSLATCYFPKPVAFTRCTASKTLRLPLYPLSTLRRWRMVLSTRRQMKP